MGHAWGIIQKLKSDEVELVLKQVIQLILSFCTFSGLKIDLFYLFLPPPPLPSGVLHSLGTVVTPGVR